MEHRNSIQAAQYSALVRVKFDVIIQYDPVDTPRRSGTSKNSSSRHFEYLDESTALESRLQDTEYWEECPISPRSFQVNTIEAALQRIATTGVCKTRIRMIEYGFIRLWAGFVFFCFHWNLMHSSVAISIARTSTRNRTFPVPWALLTPRRIERSPRHGVFPGGHPSRY